MGSGQSVSALKKAKKKPTDAEATRIWSDMDADNGGTLTVKEIIDGLKKNYPDYTASKIKAAVDHFDKDKDGKISRDEVRRPTLAHPSLAHTHAGTATCLSPQFTEALYALEISTERTKPGQKAPKRQWTIKFQVTAPAVVEAEAEAPLVADSTEELTEVHTRSMQCVCSARACSACAGALRRCYSVCGDHRARCMLSAC